MLRKELIPALILSLVGGLTACRLSSSDSGSRPDSASRDLLVSLSASEREIIRGDNVFGYGLFARLAAGDSGGNIIVSPVSVSMALTMAYNGARGETETDMARALGYGDRRREEINALYARLIPALLGADAKVTLSLANSIWYRPDLEPKREFLDLNRSSFGAEISALDFGAANAVPTLNAWVSEKTRGLIPEIAEAPLAPDLVMMLLNALYFQGDWSRQFDTKATYQGNFHLADGGTKECGMMTANGEFTVFHDSAANGLVLPYGDSLFSMVLMQPGAGTGMSDLIEALQAGSLEGWLQKAERGTGPIHVPKFDLEYGKSLKDALIGMGMGSAFSPGADLSGIQDNLMISDVIHKTAIKVDEKGTEAAAVTRVDVVVVSLPADLIRFDRPFVFAIREKNSGTVLFLGRIMDPTP